MLACSCGYASATRIEETAQRLLEVSLGDAGLTGTAGRQRLGARTSHVLEDRLLVGGVSLDRLDEVGDEVGSSLQLHRDAAPRLVDADLQLHQRVVRGPQIDAGEQDHSDNDQYRHEPFHQRPTLPRVSLIQTRTLHVDWARGADCGLEPGQAPRTRSR